MRSKIHRQIPGCDSKLNFHLKFEDMDNIKEQLTAQLRDAQKAYDDVLKKLEDNKGKNEMSEAKYLFIKGFHERIDKTEVSRNKMDGLCREIDDKVGVVKNEIDSLAKTKLVENTATVLNSLSEWQSIRVKNKDNKENSLNIEEKINQIDDEKFKNSEVKKRIDALFNLLKEVELESENAFKSAVDLHREIYSFYYALDGEGFPETIGEIKAFLEDIKKSYNAYKEEAEKKWTSAKSEKDKIDVKLKERDSNKLKIDSLNKAIDALKLIQGESP